MSSLSKDVLSNLTLIDTLYQYLGRFCEYLQQGLGLGPVITPLPEQPQILTDFQTTDIVSDFIEWIAFDDFQLKLLKGFLLVLIFNFIFICIAWNFYGQKISEKFMRPATSKAIQDLKKSVSQLKLPSEHTPRI